MGPAAGVAAGGPAGPAGGALLPQPASCGSTIPVAASEATDRNSRRDVMANPPAGAGPPRHAASMERRAWEMGPPWHTQRAQSKRRGIGRYWREFPEVPSMRTSTVVALSLLLSPMVPAALAAGPTGVSPELAGLDASVEAVRYTLKVPGVAVAVVKD